MAGRCTIAEGEGTIGAGGGAVVVVTIALGSPVVAGALLIVADGRAGQNVAGGVG